MVFSAQFISFVFAALLNVLCSSWIEEMVALNHKVMRILLAATAQLFHYCPWLLTFACLMLRSKEIWAPFLRCKDSFQYFYKAPRVCTWPQESLLPDSYPKADKPKQMKSNHPKLPVVFKSISLWGSSLSYFFWKRDGPNERKVTLQILYPWKQFFLRTLTPRDKIKQFPVLRNTVKTVI